MVTLVRSKSTGSIRRSKKAYVRVAVSGSQPSSTGALTIKSFTSPPPSQWYFWSAEWQEGERRASKDIKHGRISRFSNTSDVVSYLDHLNETI